MGRQGSFDGLVAGAVSRAREKLMRIVRLLEDAVAEKGNACGPGGPVLGRALRAELRAEGDQLAHVGDGLDGARGCQPDETVRVQVVAEEQDRVVVAGGEEAGAAVVDEIAFVDRLDREREPVLGERREDWFAVARAPRSQRLAPERTLALRVERDLLPEVSSRRTQQRPPPSGRSPRRRGRAR
jgi:hypothetical protein